MNAFDRFVANHGGDAELKTELDLERYADEYDEFMDGDDDDWEEFDRKLFKGDRWLDPEMREFYD